MNEVSKIMVDMDLRFSSGNEHPVTVARIKAEEWQALRAALVEGALQRLTDESQKLGLYDEPLAWPSLDDTSIETSEDEARPRRRPRSEVNAERESADPAYKARMDVARATLKSEQVQSLELALEALGEKVAQLEHDAARFRNLTDDQIDSATAHLFCYGRPTPGSYRINIVRAALLAAEKGGAA